MSMKKIATGAAIGAWAVTALGLGAGVANADEAVAESPGKSWATDRPDRDWDDDWRGPKWDNRRWNGPQYGNCAWVPPAVSMWVPPAVC